MLVVHVDLLMLRLMLIINIFIIDPTVCAYSVTKMGAFCYNCSVPRWDRGSYTIWRIFSWLPIQLEWVWVQNHSPFGGGNYHFLWYDNLKMAYKINIPHIHPICHLANEFHYHYYVRLSGACSQVQRPARHSSAKRWSHTIRDWRGFHWKEIRQWILWICRRGIWNHPIQ